MSEDPYLEEARWQLQEFIEGQGPSIGRAEPDRAHAEITSLAGAVVESTDEMRVTLARICEALDVTPAPRTDGPMQEWARRRAATPSGQESVDRILQERTASRRAALAVAKETPRGRHDGTQPDVVEPEQLAAARQQFMHGRYGQVAQHAALAAAANPPSDPKVAYKLEIAAREQATKEAGS